MQQFQSIEEIVEFAIQKEKEAVEFYTDLSGMETFSGARSTFEEFAREEKKHQQMLESINDNREKLAEYSYKWIPDLKRSDYMVDVAYEPGMDYREILRLAMKREEKSLALYNELQSHTAADHFIKVFRMLAQEEAKHKLALESLYDDFMAELGD